MWFFWEDGRNLCSFVISCFYMYCCWRSHYQEGRVGNSINHLIPPHCLPVPSQDLDFLRGLFLCLMSWGKRCLFVLLILVKLLTICLNFLFIICSIFTQPEYVYLRIVLISVVTYLTTNLIIIYVHDKTIRYGMYYIIKKKTKKKKTSNGWRLKPKCGITKYNLSNEMIWYP